MPKKSPLSLIPVLIFAFALALRLWGIMWALPDANRAFSFHPDESVVVAASLRVYPLFLLLDPGFYNYGSLSLLINGFFIHLGEWIGLVGPGIAPGVPSAGALLTARLVTAFLGAGTCLFLFGAGRRFYGVPVGIAAAGLYAVSPLAVQHGHFATVDVPATFFVAGSLYFAARFFTGKTTDKRAILWCGLVAGFAAATKYNAGLVLLAGVAAVVSGHLALAQEGSVVSKGEGALKATGEQGTAQPPNHPITQSPAVISRLAALFGMAVVGFLVGCPGVLLNFSAFQRDFLFEANHARTGSGDIFVGTPSGFLYHPLFNLPWAVGSLAALAIGAGVLYALYRRRPADAVLAAFVLPYFVVIGLAEIKFARYLLPILPPLLLWAGALLPQNVKGKAAITVGAALAVCGTFALWMAAGFDNRMTGPDSRDLAAAFIRTGVTDGKISSVGFPTGPWHYSPTLNPYLAVPIPAKAKEAASQTANPRLIPADGEWNVAQLTAENPDAVALSEFEYNDAIRIRKPEELAYFAALHERYPNSRIFGENVRLFGLPVTRNFDRSGYPSQNLPHDMLYTNPTTIILTK